MNDQPLLTPWVYRYLANGDICVYIILCNYTDLWRHNQKLAPNLQEKVDVQRGLGQGTQWREFLPDPNNLLSIGAILRLADVCVERSFNHLEASSKTHNEEAVNFKMHQCPKTPVSKLYKPHEFNDYFTLHTNRWFFFLQWPQASACTQISVCCCSQWPHCKYWKILDCLPHSDVLPIACRGHSLFIRRPGIPLAPRFTWPIHQGILTPETGIQQSYEWTGCWLNHFSETFLITLNLLRNTCTVPFLTTFSGVPIQKTQWSKSDFARFGQFSFFWPLLCWKFSSGPIWGLVFLVILCGNAPICLNDHSFIWSETTCGSFLNKANSLTVIWK